MDEMTSDREEQHTDMEANLASLNFAVVLLLPCHPYCNTIRSLYIAAVCHVEWLYLRSVIL